MTPLEEKLRAALRETADEIPADLPPLRLDPRPARIRRRRWILWSAPLASAAAVVALIAGSLAVTGGLPHCPPARPHPATFAPVGPDGIPLYYVALTTKGRAEEYAITATAAEVRATATGAVLVRVVPPKPYAAFTGITAAADDRTFVLSAQETSRPPASIQQQIREYPYGYSPRERFFLLRIDPQAATPGGRASLRALPAGFVPAGQTIHDMALSPDGSELAADVGGTLGRNELYVFNLASGTERAWSFRTCDRCGPDSGGLGFGGVNTDALSWTADGRHIAFVGPGSGQGTVRLLDVSLPGPDLLANSKPLVGSPPGSGPYWRGAVITPDGRTVIVVEEIAEGVPVIRQRLVKFSAVTGRPTQTLNDMRVVRGYEQVLWTSPDGRVLVVAYEPGDDSVTILHGSTHTKIPWSPYIAAAAW
jgi:hypothetical protein